MKNFRYNFPKILPEVSVDDKIIMDDFMEVWHQKLNKKNVYSLFENFNHNYCAKSKFLNKIEKKINTLEMGCGIGTHVDYEDLKKQNYYVVDIRANMLNQVKKKNLEVNIIESDIQKKLNFENKYFDRIHAIHVFEHLPKLPDCIDEVYRLLNDNGILQIVIPCDPGILYGICRQFSAKRIYEKKYKKNYSHFIKREHINSPEEILGVIKEKFKLVEKKFFPFLVPIVNLNLCIGATFKKK